MRLFQVSCVVLLLILSPVLAQTPEELIQRLKDPEPRSRRVAAEALGKQKSEAAIPALAELLKDKEASVRRAAADALVKMSPRAVPALAGALSNADEASRLAAVAALSRCGSAAKAALPALIAALKDKNTAVRIYAAMTLGEVGAEAKDALPALLEAARDTSNVGVGRRFGMASSVTEAAMDAALAIDPDCKARLAKAALPDLTQALKSKDMGVLQAAGYALAKLGPHAKSALPALQETEKEAKLDAKSALNAAIRAIGGVNALAETIKDPKVPLKKRLQALSELSWSKHPGEETATILGEALKDPEPSLRAAAVQGIGMLGPKAKAAIPTLLKLLDDEELEKAILEKTDPGAGSVVVPALVRMGSEAVPGLVEVFQDEKSKPSVRWQVARAFTQLGRKAKSALPVLEKGSKDRLLLLAIESSCAYARAGGDVSRVVPVLRANLKDERPSVLWNAASAVERIGPSARAAVPELMPLLKHEEREIRIIAARALSQMGAAARPAVLAMAELLKAEDRRQRTQVARALERLGPDARKALPVLIEQLKDLEQMSPNPIVVTLGNIGPDAREAVPALVEILKKDERLLPRDAMQTLGRIGPDAHAAVPVLGGLLEKSSPYTRAGAARALGQIGPKAKAVVPALRKLLEDENTTVRIWAAFALARITGDSKPNLAVILELRKEDTTGKDPVRGPLSFEVAQALELLGADARPARDLLLEALLDPNTNPGTHACTARALGQLREDAEVIVPRLIVLLERPGEGFRRQSNCEHAAEALGMLGPKAKAAIPTLLRLAEDEDNEIAEAAARALAKIESK